MVRSRIMKDEGPETLATAQELRMQEQFTEALEAIRRESELQHRYLRWSAGIFSTIVILAGALGAFLFGNSLAAMRTEIRESVGFIIAEEISENEDAARHLDALVADYQSGVESLNQLRSTAESLRFLEEVSEVGDDIAPLIYARMSDLEVENQRLREAAGPETRGNDNSLFLEPSQATELAVLFDWAIEAGISLQMDPNNIFNASMIAARMGFEAQAAQLRAVAYHVSPSQDYQMARLASEDLLGIRWEVGDSGLVASTMEPQQVREQAWREALLSVRSAPPMAQTQTYSQASNIAVRNRGAGYYAELIDALAYVVSERPELVSVYTHAQLARLHVINGANGWRERYNASRDLAITSFSTASPSLPQFEPSIRSLLFAAKEISEQEVGTVVEQLVSAGVDPLNIRRAISTVEN